MYGRTNFVMNCLVVLDLMQYFLGLELMFFLSISTPFPFWHYQQLKPELIYIKNSKKRLSETMKPFTSLLEILAIAWQDNKDLLVFICCVELFFGDRKDNWCWRRSDKPTDITEYNNVWSGLNKSKAAKTYTL